MIGKHSEKAPAMPLIADNSPTPKVVTTIVRSQSRMGEHAPGTPLTRAYPSAEYAAFNSFAFPTTNQPLLHEASTPSNLGHLFDKIQELQIHVPWNTYFVNLTEDLKCLECG
jgi:hypothetical protein